ncbi:MAG: bifunctional folylpolyglutamate synthase/dihydrofolate synthase [Bacteroidales bacterium]|jgi:dihydrofolate synthase/folylpolyglutamate synthase|nr:bifunctional folylpolyglutamate synthase/dihydrofolate synthase [Bacteroidales bacterium]
MYQDILAKLFSAFPMYHKQGTSAYKEGLENIEELAELTGYPEKRFKTVHVAGTNGKGSVSHLLASYFQEAGYKTGLFTSPHLVDFSERIKINGKPIPEERVIDFFNRYQSELDRIEPSFFEMTTVLAFDYFANEQVDVAIIEVGLGGRLDSTNIINPVLSVITNISQDHTQLLGITFAEIAYEKGGIIKSGTPVVIGETHPDSEPVFRQIAGGKDVPIYFADQLASGRVDELTSSLVHSSTRSLLTFPDYQRKNIITFAVCVDVLQDYFDFPSNNLCAAISNLYKNTGLMGRWQVLEQEPLTICDVGHNVGAFEVTIKQLIRHNRTRVHFVFGMVNDKDIDAVLSLFPEEHFTYYCCRAENDRMLTPEILEQKLKDKGLTTVLCDTVGNAYKQARQAFQVEDIIFIGGSCFVVGEFLSLELDTFA